MSGDECHEEPGEFDSKAGVLCNNIVSELLGTQELCRSMRKLLSPPISGRTGLLVVNGAKITGGRTIPGQVGRHWEFLDGSETIEV